MSAQYTIIWKHFKKNSPIGTRLSAKEDFSLPYFLEGEEKKKFEQKEAVELHVLHLVKGLLVGYFDKPPATDTAFAQKHALTIIEEQLNVFQSPSTEALIIDLSNYLRDTHGQQASLQSLMAGTEILPESSVIKYDCSIDLINCIDEGELDDRITAIQKLKILLSKIDTDKINPELAADYNEMIAIAEEMQTKQAK